MPAETDFGYRAYDIAVDPTLAPEEAVERWMRHLLVFALRREMTAGATPRVAVAQLLGVTEGHLGRKLAGTTALTLEDVVRLMIAFGPALLPRFDNVEDIFPPAYRGRLRWARLDGTAQATVI